MPLSHCDTWIVDRQWAYSVQRVPDCLGGLSRVGISSRSTRPWNGQPPSICNMSLTSGIFPNNMKIAKVIPLYKANGKNEFTNYRPVSLLPQFSKILEKLFGIRLDSFIDRYNLLSSNQYGFRRNMSTSLALMELTEEITTALDDKKKSLWVSLLT